MKTLLHVAKKIIDLKLCGGAEIKSKLIYPFPEFSGLIAQPLNLAGSSGQLEILGSSTPSTNPNICFDGDTC